MASSWHGDRTTRDPPFFALPPRVVFRDVVHFDVRKDGRTVPSSAPAAVFSVLQRRDDLPPFFPRSTRSEIGTTAYPGLGDKKHEVR